MTHITHVSFDVWNTLIEPNPEYGYRRTYMLASLFNESEEFIKTQYTAVKKYIDDEAIKTGIAATTDQIISLLISRVIENGSSTENWTRLLPVGSKGRAYHTHIRENLKRLFHLYPPLMTTGVKEAVWALRDNGITVSIGSNSNFVTGLWMSEYLDRHLQMRVGFKVFSDLLGYAKPSHWFFNEVWESAHSLNPRVTEPANIMHIGDHYMCDGEGAGRVGMSYAVISSPMEVPGVVHEIIKEQAA